MKKLIAVDLDGTLLNSKNEIGKKNKEVIHKLIDLGHRVVVITGRDFYGSVHVARELFMGDFGLLSSSNGANVYDLEKEKTIIDHLISPELMKEMADFGEKLGFDYMVYKDGKVLAANPEAFDLDYLARKNKIEVEIVYDLKNKLGRGLNKVLFTARPDIIDKNLEDFRKEFEGRVNPIHSMPQFVDCMPAGIDKGKSLIEIAKYYNIDRADTIAFGDMTNDREMIRAAGLGVAMANADEDLKKIADAICPSNDEDGIGSYLEAKLLR